MDGYVSEDRRKEPESRDFERKGYAGSGDWRRARYFKKGEEGRKIMSKIMEQLLNEEKIEAASVCWKEAK